MLIDAHLYLWNTQLLHYEWLQRPENAVLAGTATRFYALGTML